MKLNSKFLLIVIGISILLTSIIATNVVLLISNSSNNNTFIGTIDVSDYDFNKTVDKNSFSNNLNKWIVDKSMYDISYQGKTYSINITPFESSYSYLVTDTNGYLNYDLNKSFSEYIPHENNKLLVSFSDNRFDVLKNDIFSFYSLSYNQSDIDFTKLEEDILSSLSMMMTRKLFKLEDYIIEQESLNTVINTYTYSSVNNNDVSHFTNYTNFTLDSNSLIRLSDLINTDDFTDDELNNIASALANLSLNTDIKLFEFEIDYSIFTYDETSTSIMFAIDYDRNLDNFVIKNNSFSNYKIDLSATINDLTLTLNGLEYISSKVHEIDFTSIEYDVVLDDTIDQNTPNVKSVVEGNLTRYTLEGVLGQTIKVYYVTDNNQDTKEQYYEIIINPVSERFNIIDTSGG